MIHAFNEQGFAALDPQVERGRPPRFGPPVRELVCRIAKTPPQNLGRPFTTWSLAKLAEAKRISISAESVRAILRSAGITWQATKTWKGSKDPEFAAKMARILDLYDHPPADGRVVCIDLCRPRNYADIARGGTRTVLVSGLLPSSMHRRLGIVPCRIDASVVGAGCSG